MWEAAVAGYNEYDNDDDDDMTAHFSLKFVSAESNGKARDDAHVARVQASLEDTNTKLLCNSFSAMKMCTCFFLKPLFTELIIISVAIKITCMHSRCCIAKNKTTRTTDVLRRSKTI